MTQQLLPLGSIETESVALATAKGHSAVENLAIIIARSCIKAFAKEVEGHRDGLIRDGMLTEGRKAAIDILLHFCNTFFETNPPGQPVALESWLPSSHEKGRLYYTIREHVSAILHLFESHLDLIFGHMVVSPDLYFPAMFRVDTIERAGQACTTYRLISATGKPSNHLSTVLTLYMP